MKTIEIYVADDGTRFEDEDECLAYEERTKYDNGSIIVLNGDFKFIDPKNGFDNWIEESIYIRIVNPLEAMSLMDYIKERYGYALPDCEEFDEGDVWKYEYKEGYCAEWVNLTKRVKEEVAELESVLGATNAYIINKNKH